MVLEVQPKTKRRIRLEKKADLAVELARLVLPEEPTLEEVEEKALAYMDLTVEEIQERIRKERT